MIESKIPVSCIFLFPFACGIIFWKYFPFPREIVLIFFISAVVFTFVLSFFFKRISSILLCIFMLASGMLCAGFLNRNSSADIPLDLKKIVAVYGHIKDVRERGQLLSVAIENTMLSNGRKWFETGIEIRTLLPDETRIYVSDWIYLYDIREVKKSGKNIVVISKSRKVIQPISPLQNFIRKTHLTTEKLVKKWFKYHGQEAAIFKMMVLGDKRQSLEIKHIFVKTGIYHLLIVSGIHLGYLVLFLRLIFFPVRKFEQVHYRVFDFIYLVAIVSYSALTGFSTPVVRAALMIGIYIIAEIIGRPVSSIDSIGWAAFFILFFKPDELFSMGFQLSFAATTGIIIAMRNIPPIKKIPSWLDSTIRAITGAQLFTIPVLAGNTGSFYPSGFITNFFLVPVGGITVFFGLSFLIFGFLRHIIIFPLIKMLEFFWISTKMFSAISPEISWMPAIPVILAIYSIIFAMFFRNKWKIFFVSAFLMIMLQLFLCGKQFKEIQTYIPPSNGVQGITIYPCKKLLCTIEKQNYIILILSGKENFKTLEPVFENMKEKNKEIILFFTDAPHDTISQIELALRYFKPRLVVDNPDIKKNPGFGYRKCFFFADTGIKQKFWKFLKPFGKIRIIYNHKGTQVIEYKTEKGTIIISNYINSTIFEILPFSPCYHIIYATDLALSKKLVQQLEEYETKQVLYQKIVYDTAEKPLPFKIIRIENPFTIEEIN